MFVLKRCASIVAAAFILLAVGLTGPASAGSTQAKAVFGGQARAAGLTAGQTQALQAKMDRYLARHGGQQVAANEIRLTGGATLTVTVPGEAYVRDMAAPASTRSAAQWECEYGYFCLYRNTLGMGDRLALYYCQDYALDNWVGEGSYYNNQTRDTRAQFKDQNRTVIHTTPGAPWSMASFDWTPVWYVKPC